MNKLYTTVCTIFIFAISFVSSANAMDDEWVEGTCGEPITAYAERYEMSALESNKFDYVDYMEREEPSADGSVSPIW